MKEFLEEYGGMVAICLVGMSIIVTFIGILTTITSLP